MIMNNKRLGIRINKGRYSTYHVATGSKRQVIETAPAVFLCARKFLNSRFQCFDIRTAGYQGTFEAGGECAGLTLCLVNVN